MNPRTQHILGRTLFALVAASYLLGFPYHPKLRSPNELSRLWMSISLVEHGTLEINQVLRDYGYVGDLSVKDGKYYPSKAPLLSFEAVPVYAALQAVHGPGLRQVGEVPLVFWSRLFFTVLPTLVMLFFLRRFLRTYLSAAVADVLVVTYALGTMALNYSWMFLSHQQTAVLLFFSFYALWRTGRGEWGRWGSVVAGAFAGASIACEYTSALGVAALLLYAVLDRWHRTEGSAGEKLRRVSSEAGLAVVGALPFVALLAWYHDAAFGHPLVSGYKHLNDAAYQPWHVGGFLGIRFPDPRAFVLSFFSPLRGLFAVSPFLLLSLLGIGFMLSRRVTDSTKPERALGLLALVYLLGMTYFTSAFSYDSWGWAAGPRHMTGLLPFLLLPVGLVLERGKSAGSRWGQLAFGAAVGLCAVSVVVTGTIALLNYVPDDLSTSLFGVAVPLFREGYLPASVLSFWGVPNPWAGGLVWLLLSLCALGVIALGLRGGRAIPLVGVALVAGLHLGLLFAATKDHAWDQGARSFLRSVWLAPPGQPVPFLPPRLGM